MASLADKVGIVTGGGTGIGRATALAMARAGASLVIGNRGAKLGEEVVRAIERAGGHAATWPDLCYRTCVPARRGYTARTRNLRCGSGITVHRQRGRSRLAPNELSHLR